MENGLYYIIENNIEIAKLNMEHLLKRRARYHLNQALWSWIFRYRECLYFFLKKKKSRDVYDQILKLYNTYSKNN